MAGINDIRGLTADQMAELRSRPKKIITVGLPTDSHWLLQRFLASEKRRLADEEDDSRWVIPEFGEEW